MTRPAQRICLGVVTGPHGVRGLLRVKTFTAEPEGIAAYGPLEDENGTRRFDLELVGVAKGVVLVRMAGIADRDAAERLKGQRLYVRRVALPPPGEEEYYHADLIGLVANLADGSLLGRVSAVHDFGAGDSLEIVRPGGGVVMVPFTRAIVPVVDPAGGRLVVMPPPGLLDAGLPDDGMMDEVRSAPGEPGRGKSEG